jgi:hypothetical protein
MGVGVSYGRGTHVCSVQGSSIGVWGLFEVQGLRFFNHALDWGWRVRIRGFGFGVWGVGFRVQGLWLRVEG